MYQNNFNKFIYHHHKKNVIKYSLKKKEQFKIEFIKMAIGVLTETAHDRDLVRFGEILC